MNQAFDPKRNYEETKKAIEDTFPLEKASEAFDKAEFGKPRGKVMIEIQG